MITKRVAMIFAAYRIADFSDPIGAAALMSSVLEDYPDHCIMFVSDAKTGIQRKSKWPPTLSELVDFCDDRMGHLAKMDRHKNWGESEPEIIEAPPILKPTREEMLAKYGKNYGIDQGETHVSSAKVFSAPSWDELIPVYQADPSRMARLTGAFMTRSGSEMPSGKIEAAVAAATGEANLTVLKVRSAVDNIGKTAVWPGEQAA
jgi:hypothetical protein